MEGYDVFIPNSKNCRCSPESRLSTRRDSQKPGNEIPGDCAHEHGNDQENGQVDHLRIESGEVNNIAPNRMRDRGSEEKRANEFADGSHDQRFLGREGPRRDDGRYHVGSVVKSVRIVEEKGKTDDDGGEQKDRTFDGEPPVESLLPV
jgi:hypothetical protein